MPMISVIVPVYNADKHLHCCIDSILAQSFTDFELLLIDDGSKDSSGRICDEYATKDSRVRVFHKENGGVSSARNLALDKVQGEWIAFIDADDYVKKEYLIDLYNDAVANNADFVIQDFEFVKENGTVIDRWYKSVEGVYLKEDIIRLVKEQSLETRGYSVSKLFASSIIRQHVIRYPLGVRFGEDSCFVFQYLTFVNCTCCSAKSNYCYIDHPGSAIHRKHDFATEFNGYNHIRNSVTCFYGKYAIGDALDDTVTPWVAHFMHRALTVAKKKAELSSIPKEDWTFFNEHFRAITRKTAIDRWMISHFYKFPSILLPYLRFNVWFREFIVRHGMNGLLNKLKK